jgi:hypothetical protein
MTPIWFGVLAIRLAGHAKGRPSSLLSSIVTTAWNSTGTGATVRRERRVVALALALSLEKLRAHLLAP